MKSKSVLLWCGVLVFVLTILCGPGQALAATWKVRAYNADDYIVAYVGGIEVARASWGSDSDWVEITNYLQSGWNTVSFDVYNTGGGWTYGFMVTRNNEVYFQTHCGIANDIGCGVQGTEVVGRVFTQTIQVEK